MTKIRLLLICVFANLSLSAQALEISDMNVFLRGSDTSGKTIDIRFNVKNITDSDFGGSQASQENFRALLNQKLAICYNTSECSYESDQRIRYSEENQTGAQNSSENIIDGFIETSSLSFNVDTDDSTKYKGSVVYKASLTGVDTFEVGSSVYYVYSDGRISDATIQKYTSVTDNPEGLDVSSQNQGITVTWTKKASVSYAGNNLQSPPVGMRAYLIPAHLLDNSGSASFDGVMTGYDTASGEVSSDKYSCVLNADTAEDTCTFTCDNGEATALLNSDTFTTNYPDVLVKETSDSTSNAITFSGLVDTDIKYALILQYLPDGLRAGDHTACVLGSSVETFTYTQISGGDEPKLENPNCFIATAAYGSPLAPQLDELRWFRDQVLDKFYFGRLAVKTYYEYSPKLAEKLKQSDIGQRAVRWALTPVVFIIASFRAEPTTSLMAIFGLFSIVSLLMIRRRIIRN